jgi:hypothetical protein
MFITWYFRDRPFNLQEGLWFFVSFRKKFPDNTRVGIFIFLSRKARNLFYNSTLGYMTKTLTQINFFFPPPKSVYIFQCPVMLIILDFLSSKNEEFVKDLGYQIHTKLKTWLFRHQQQICPAVSKRNFENKAK